MAYWYINKDKIIKSNANLEAIKDKLENTQIYYTYNEAVKALSLL